MLSVILELVGHGVGGTRGAVLVDVADIARVHRAHAFRGYVCAARGARARRRARRAHVDALLSALAADVAS